VVRPLDHLLQASTVDTANPEDIPVSLPPDLLQASTVDIPTNPPRPATARLLPTIKDSSNTASNNFPPVAKHREVTASSLPRRATEDRPPPTTKGSSNTASNNTPPVAKHREVTASSLPMASNNTPLPDGTERR
jgi:hypothetical protein